MKASVVERAKNFDSDGTVKSLVNEALQKLKSFRGKYPFVENPDSIETLTSEDIFKKDSGEIGDFFHYVEYYLKPLGYLTLYSNVYRRIRSHLDVFKELLHIVVDKEKSLSEKVDAQWNSIKGLGGDSHIAKKIIFCFNYETGLVAPIFSTGHLEYFLGIILEEPWLQLQYDNMSLGEKYESLTNALLKARGSSPVTKSWEITCFCRFLYETYTPPRISTETQRKELRSKALLERQQQFREFTNLLNELVRCNKISFEQFRTYRKQWEENPQDRGTLTDNLERLKPTNKSVL